MIEIRCPVCNHLLIKANICKGEIKCMKCRKIIKIDTNNKDRVSRTKE